MVGSSQGTIRLCSLLQSLFQSLLRQTRAMTWFQSFLSWTCGFRCGRAGKHDAYNAMRMRSTLMQQRSIDLSIPQSAYTTSPPHSPPPSLNRSPFLSCSLSLTHRHVYSHCFRPGTVSHPRSRQQDLLALQRRPSLAAWPLSGPPTCPSCLSGLLCGYVSVCVVSL